MLTTSISTGTSTNMHKTAHLGDLVAGSDIIHRTHAAGTMDERGK